MSSEEILQFVDGEYLEPVHKSTWILLGKSSEKYLDPAKYWELVRKIITIAVLDASSGTTK